MDVRVGMVGTMMASDSSENEELYLLVTGARHDLTDRAYPVHSGHSDFEFWEVRSPGIFVLVSGSEGISRLICLALHTYVHYQMSEKK